MSGSALHDIPGGEALFDWFGRVPRFHDAKLLEITFYEDSNCYSGIGLQPGDLGLFYMTCPAGFCGATGYDAFGQGFAEVTEAPEPSSLWMFISGLVVLLGTGLMGIWRER